MPHLAFSQPAIVPVPPPAQYTAEDGVTAYTAEDGATPYTAES